MILTSATEIAQEVWVHWVVYNIPPDTKSLPENEARQGCRKAPYLGSMISKRPGMAARVRRSAGTVTSISSTRWISRSI